MVWHPARGTPSWLDQWCAIGAGTSRGILCWRCTYLPYKRMGMCESIYIDTMHLKDPLVLFGVEGPALSLFRYFFFHMLCHCSSTMAKDHFTKKKHFMALNSLLCRCAFKPSFIYSLCVGKPDILHNSISDCHPVPLGIKITARP